MSDFGDQFVSFLFGEAVGRAPFPEESVSLDWENAEDAEDEGEAGDDAALGDDVFQEAVVEDWEAPTEPAPRRREPPLSEVRRRAPRPSTGIELRLYGRKGEPLRRMRYEGTRREGKAILRELLEEAAIGLASGRPRAARRLVGGYLQIVTFHVASGPSPRSLGTYGVSLKESGAERWFAAEPLSEKGLGRAPARWWSPL